MIRCFSKFNTLAITFFMVSLTYLNLGKCAEKRLIGKALLEYSIFAIDVYEINYFQGPDNYEEIELNYKVDVKQEHTAQGWTKSLAPWIKENPKLNNHINWLAKNSPGFVKGDKFQIIKNRNEVKFMKNGKKLIVSKDKNIIKLCHEPWIGRFPIDEEIKNQLIGKKGD